MSAKRCVASTVAGFVVMFGLAGPKLELARGVCTQADSPSRGKRYNLEKEIHWPSGTLVPSYS